MVLDLLVLIQREKEMKKIMTQIGKFVLVQYFELKVNLSIIISLFLMIQYNLFLKGDIILKKLH